MYSILLNEKHIKGSLFGSKECLLLKESSEFDQIV